MKKEMIKSVKKMKFALLASAMISSQTLTGCYSLLAHSKTNNESLSNDDELIALREKLKKLEENALLNEQEREELTNLRAKLQYIEENYNLTYNDEIRLEDLMLVLENPTSLDVKERKYYFVDKSKVEKERKDWEFDIKTVMTYKSLTNPNKEIEIEITEVKNDLPKITNCYENKCELKANQSVLPDVFQKYDIIYGIYDSNNIPFPNGFQSKEKYDLKEIKAMEDALNQDEKIIKESQKKDYFGQNLLVVEFNNQFFVVSFDEKIAFYAEYFQEKVSNVEINQYFLSITTPKIALKRTATPTDEYPIESYMITSADEDLNVLINNQNYDVNITDFYTYMPAEKQNQSYFTFQEIDELEKKLNAQQKDKPTIRSLIKEQ